MKLMGRSPYNRCVVKHRGAGGSGCTLILTGITLAKDECCSPSRSHTASGALVRVSIDGVRESRVRNDSCGTCLLPHDARSMRSNGNACFPGLLREGSARSLRKCLEVESGALPPDCRADLVDSIFRHFGRRQR